MKGSLFLPRKGSESKRYLESEGASWYHW